MEKFEWWSRWIEKKHRYNKSAEGQLDRDLFFSTCIGTGLPNIHQKSTFAFQSAEQGAQRFQGISTGGEKPFSKIYTRLGNPNSSHLERTITQLECHHILEAAHKAGDLEPLIGSILYSSGMGAISSVLISLTESGDSLVLGNVYGCTDSFARMMERKYQVKIHWLQSTHPEELRDILAKDDKVKGVLIESPVNPTLEMYDLKAFSALTEQHGCPLIVDNTFCSPYLQQPFRWGADIVIHSLTKHINGHSTSIGGIAIGPAELFAGELFITSKDLGSTPSPFDSWLNSMTLQDMPMRIEKACANAKEVATFLNQHPKVERTTFPGLESHPQHALCLQQMRNGGTMISFEVRGGYQAGVELMNFFAREDTPMELTVSLGSVISYIQHPASMTHSVVPEDIRIQRGIPNSLVRLSVGCEGVSTLLEALDRGLNLS
jgi:methionine-gamma-lyase